MKDNVRFILFSIGLGAAVASCITSIIFLYSNLLGQPNIVYEDNSLLALFEIVLLTLGIATCITAPEIYLKYLELKKSHSK